jgi:hypothetical protein
MIHIKISLPKKNDKEEVKFFRVPSHKHQKKARIEKNDYEENLE